MSIDLRLDIAAIVLLAAFVALGMLVSRRPLTRLDAEAVYFRGQATRIALLFTLSGRSRALTAACLLSIAIFALLRLPLGIPLILTGSQLVSQLVVAVCKTFFRRVRPDYWLVGREAGHSYPSGHATTAVVFFIGWALVIALSPLGGGIKTALIAALTVWSLGIIWSRLALGAHYLTDVTGGVLFGAAWLCALSSHLYAILSLPG
ncbi:MAG TPA: phosphatase PAP2 family protein [Candidatus Baltobacteraceae bacterium]|nr:phosphatase PAP2 family protein [Candidatus Baltobacteraceae bacterium]